DRYVGHTATSTFEALCTFGRSSFTRSAASLRSRFIFQFPAINFLRLICFVLYSFIARYTERLRVVRRQVLGRHLHGHGLTAMRTGYRDVLKTDEVIVERTLNLRVIEGIEGE